MSQSKLHKRATALENAFFHRVDQELIVRIQEQHQQDLDKDALATATGIIDRSLLDELLAAEITPKTLLALSLFPAVYVAWSDGHVELGERKAILQAAESLGISDGTPAWDLVNAWLRKRPTQQLIDVWGEFVHGMQPTLSVTAFRQLQTAAMERAERIAEAAGGFMGFHKVSKVEREALEHLDRVFDDAAQQEIVAS